MRLVGHLVAALRRPSASLARSLSQLFPEDYCND